MNQSKAPQPATGPKTARPRQAKPQQAKTPAAKPGAEPAVRPEPPRPVQLAVRLMYAGAALTVIGLLISVIAVANESAALLANHKPATAAQIHATRTALIMSAVVWGLVEAGVWTVMARANRGGLKWARIVASVLFAVNTAWSLLILVAGKSAPTSAAYMILLWLVGLGAVYFLWHKDSSGYFT